MRQAQALAVMERGDSVFLTGPAGSGKTYVLNQFIEWARRQKRPVAVTASTGIAATHIGGTTVHSWSGLGIRDSLSQADRAWLSGNERLIKRYNSVEVLIIDEVSMLHGTRLDMINEACQLLRRSDAPFGGLQIILTGDLFQLPPVNRLGGPDDFAHLSAAWQQLNPRICYLGEQHRQRGDGLLEILQAMRGGQLTSAHQETLRQRINIKPPDDLVLTRLYAHNVDVEVINQRELEALPGELQTFEMATSGRAAAVEQLQKSVLAPARLELKIGAQVMFVANNFAQGFVNGTRGEVVDFDGDTPIVRLQAGGREIAVEPHSWTLTEDGRTRAELTQLPLRLAWAITIHKSQGMSLDSALIDLGKSFTPGMGYVGLSRVRTLDGLFLAGLNDMALRLHPDIYDFDARLQTASDALAKEVGEVVIKKNVSIAKEDEPAVANPQLVAALRAWRTWQATAKNLPAYIIAHNKTLDAVAARRPQTPAQLLAVKGVGQKFVDAYGEEVLAITGDGQPAASALDAEAAQAVADFAAAQGLTLTPAKHAALLKLLQE